MLSLWGLSLLDPRYFINPSPNCKAEPVTIQASSWSGMVGQGGGGSSQRKAVLGTEWLGFQLSHNLVFILSLILS